MDTKLDQRKPYTNKIYIIKLYPTTSVIQLMHLQITENQPFSLNLRVMQLSDLNSQGH